MSESSDPNRYFFAVWPDATVRAQLADWSQAIRADRPARRVVADNLHITLAFLGSLDPPALDAVRRVAGGTRWSAATLVLDRIGYWKRARIVWAGSKNECEPLSRLAESLRDDLRRLGFRIDTRPFVPHVTLQRKVRRRPKWEARSVSWPIEEFCLVQSRLSPEGARYEVIDHWSAPGDME